MQPESGQRNKKLPSQSARSFSLFRLSLSAGMFNQVVMAAIELDYGAGILFPSS